MVGWEWMILQKYFSTEIFLFMYEQVQLPQYKQDVAIANIIDIIHLLLLFSKTEILLAIVNQCGYLPKIAIGNSNQIQRHSLVFVLHFPAEVPSAHFTCR